MKLSRNCGMLSLACFGFLLWGSALSENAARSVYDFEVLDIDEQPQSLRQYEGKVLLMVNTASKCGFTKQYEPLQKLYERYRSQGFEILAFPANNFLRQEPGDNASIKKFCELSYQTTFPLFAKISVSGKDMHPLYHYLTRESALPGRITWNFNKFLINRKGDVVARFGSRVDPLGDELVEAVKQALEESF